MNLRHNQKFLPDAHKGIKVCLGELLHQFAKSLGHFSSWNCSWERSGFDCQNQLGISKGVLIRMCDGDVMGTQHGLIRWGFVEITKGV
jgi:hypothetical protein